MNYVAEQLKIGLYVVRPEGALGTHGWIKGEPWEVVYVRTHSPVYALIQAKQERERRRVARIAPLMNPE